KIHRLVAVDERTDALAVLLTVEVDDQLAGEPGCAQCRRVSEEVRGLGQDRVTRQIRRSERFKRLLCPIVQRVPTVEERDQRPGIDDELHRRRRRKAARTFSFVADRPSPLTEPAAASNVVARFGPLRSSHSETTWRTR